MKRYLLIRYLKEEYEVYANSRKEARGLPTEDPSAVIIIKETVKELKDGD